MALTDKLKAIANAIRTKTGKSAQMSLDDMVREILSISGEGGGGGPMGFTKIYDGTFELTKNPTTTNAIVGTIPITNVSSYPLLLVIISNRDSTPSAKKFNKSAAMFVNMNYKSGGVSITKAGCVLTYSSTGSSLLFSIANASSVYGIWANSLVNTGQLQINGRFNSSYFGTLVDTYNVEVYAMDYVLQA